MKKIAFQIVLGLLSGVLGAALYYEYIILPKQIAWQDAVLSQSNYSKIPVTITKGRNGQDTLSNTLAPSDFIQASQIATPSVVYIKNISSQQAIDWFDWYFGGGNYGSRVISSGSGVIYSADGFIITNNHVIEGAESIEVIHNKKTYKAKIIGRDPSTDLAVLKIEARNLPNIRLARSRDVQVGEWVLAVGNPFNLTSTVTAGIVSAKGRALQLIRGSRFPIESFIQTDAAINPGNSGGALVNLKGELVGINTAILSKTGSYAGYGFAVPSDIVAKVVSDLIQFGEVQKAFLGIEVIDINSEIAQEYGLKELDGVLVDRVMKEGAGFQAGLQKGDVILKINQEPINSRADFDENLSYFRPGDEVTITYKRKGKLEQKKIKLTNQQGTTDASKKNVLSDNDLGADLEKVPKIELEKIGIKNGVRISNLRRGFFKNNGFEEGFIIIRINGVEVNEPQQVVELLNKSPRRITIEGIDRYGSTAYYSFTR
ncbi:MAG: trypsin-like peptidase domain-containing protein [Raineya sp.]|nr:trypsin-like peptidase domain-containing protein [Raineya sp.]MDW8296080.1 trypsin-like peptidase domain-containing protein [Raineya sp.]